MLTVSILTVNPFRENTYVLHNSAGHALIIDPGMSNAQEEADFMALVAQAKLLPERIILTHCHIDHILGVRPLNLRYRMAPYYHELEELNYNEAMAYGPGIGLPIAKKVDAAGYLKEGDLIEMEGGTLEVIETPGHSSGSLSFYCREQSFLIGGDVLFRESIGRTDLPGGDNRVLIQTVQRLIATLPPETIVYPGHGPETSIGYEARFNPYLSSTILR